MKIGFLLGSAGISGGTYVIYEHATRLKRFGHQVVIITEQTVSSEQYGWHPEAGELQWLSLEKAKNEPFDIAIATWWKSPLLLKDIQSTYSVYFVQSIETRFFEPADPADHSAQDHTIWQELCEKTYSIVLPMITEARWIQEYIYQKYNTSPFLVLNGIRKDVYTPSGPAAAPPLEPGRLRILVEGPVDVSYKNVPTSIDLARRAGVDEIWLLTSSDISAFPDVDRVFSRVAINETPAIYRSCDVLLKLSHVEGMFGPPLEMFHCGGTAIVYSVTGHDEYIVHNENSLVADRDDETGVIQYLQQLKNEPETLGRLKEGARRTAQQWPDWEVSAGEFEKALFEIASQKPTSRNYLVRWADELIEGAKPQVKARHFDTFLKREKQFSQDDPSGKHNFVEFYWHSGEQFNQKNFLWKHYRCEEWQTISFEVAVTGFPFWLRIDPSIRIGVVRVATITVTNMSTRSEIMAFQKADDFGVLFLWGTVCWLVGLERNVVLSYGEDPMLILPPVEETAATVGDRLKIAITLKETGIQQFFNEYPLGSGRNRPALTGRFLPRSWKQRLKKMIGVDEKRSE